MGGGASTAASRAAPLERQDVGHHATESLESDTELAPFAHPVDDGENVRAGEEALFKEDGSHVSRETLVQHIDAVPETKMIDDTAQAKDDDVVDVLRDTPLDSIWQCRRPEERREWTEKNKEKLGRPVNKYIVDKLANALASDKFQPAELVSASLGDLHGKMKAVDNGIPQNQKQKLCDALRHQGHGFYRPAQYAIRHDPHHELGSFLFDSVLGRGSFGEVYKIAKRNDAKFCSAIKFSATQNSTKSEYKLNKVSKIEDAREEVAKMMRIRSEFVLRAMSHGEEPALGLFWSLTELCLGGELDARMKPQRIKEVGPAVEPIAWRWMTEVCLGLVHMHNKCIMHNDIKPEVPLRRSCRLLELHFFPRIISWRLCRRIFYSHP